MSLDTTATLPNFVLSKAGRGSIAGVVRNSDTQETIERVTVEAIVEDPTSELKSTQTDYDGAYTLTQVLSGRRQVVASARHYSSMAQTVRVNAGQTLPLDFSLKPKP